MINIKIVNADWKIKLSDSLETKLKNDMSIPQIAAMHSMHELMYDKWNESYDLTDRSNAKLIWDKQNKLIQSETEQGMPKST